MCITDDDLGLHKANLNEDVKKDIVNAYFNGMENIDNSQINRVFDILKAYLLQVKEFWNDFASKLFIIIDKLNNQPEILSKFQRDIIKATDFLKSAMVYSYKLNKYFTRKENAEGNVQMFKPEKLFFYNGDSP